MYFKFTVIFACFIFNGIIARDFRISGVAQIDHSYHNNIPYNYKNITNHARIKKEAVIHKYNEDNSKDHKEYDNDIFSPTTAAKQGLPSISSQQPTREIPYKITNQFYPSTRAMIMNIIDDIQKNTCVRFVTYTNEKAYIHITSNNIGCHTSVDHTNNINNITLQEPDCVSLKRVIIHKLINAIKSIHDYILTSHEDTPLSMRYSEEQLKQMYISNFTIPHDHNNSNIETRQNIKLNPQDIVKINTMYKCPGVSSPRSENVKKSNSHRGVLPSGQKDVKYNTPNLYSYLHCIANPKRVYISPGTRFRWRDCSLMGY